MTVELVAVLCSSAIALGSLWLLWLMQRQLAVTLRDLTHAVVAKQDPEALLRLSQFAGEARALRESRLEFQAQNGGLGHGMDDGGFAP